MTVGFRADAETINGTAGTSVVVNRPTGTADGDVLVAFITGTGTPTISTPAGWTLIGTVTAGTAVRAAAFYKVASGEPASWTWTLGSSVRNGGWVGAFTGVDTAAPLYDSEPQTDVTAGTSWFGGIASVRSQGAAVGFAALSRTATGTGTTHTTTGTERGDQTTNGGAGIDLSYAAATSIFTGAGGTTAITVTSSQSCANGAMWTVSLAPAFVPYDGGDTGTIVEAAFGADPDDPDPDTNWVWTDISADVLEEPGVTIGKGRQDEQSQIGPTSVSLSLNNDDGRYTPTNAIGANYPNIRRGLPIRVSVPYGYGLPTERATAFVEGYVPGWDTSLSFATVEVSALGRLSRLRAGDTVRSPLFRTITGVTGVTPAAQAYWPMEDGSGATQFANERGGRPMGVNTGLSPGSDSTLAGSASLPSYTAGGQVVGPVDPYTGTGQWSVLLAMRLDAVAVSETVLMDVVTTGTATLWRLSINPASPDQLRVRVIDSEGNQILDDSVSVDETAFYTGWKLLEMSAVQNGANIDYDISFTAPASSGVSGNGKSGTLNSRTAGTVYRAGNGGTGQWAIEGACGHFALFTDPGFVPGLGGTVAAIAAQALDGQDGEVTATRFNRVLGEEGVHVDLHIPADTDLLTEMGPQPVANLDTILREIEESEQGVIHDGGELGGLVIVDRAAKYNKAVDLVLDMESGHIAPGWSPVYDTQKLRTRSTVSRTGGSSATYTGDTAEGIFNDSASLSLVDDGRLEDFASWRVHVGATPGMRYPRVGMNFRRNPGLVEDWLALEIGMSRVTATGLPSQHGPIDLDGFVEGYTEHLAGFVWTVDLNLSPASPYTVGVWEDPVLGRADTDGSRLGSAINAAVTSISVETTAGNPWITTASHAAEFPFDIKIDGEVMTVTAITSATSPQTFTVTRATDGTAAAHADEAPVNLANPMIVAL